MKSRTAAIQEHGPETLALTYWALDFLRGWWDTYRQATAQAGFAAEFGLVPYLLGFGLLNFLPILAIIIVLRSRDAGNGAMLLLYGMTLLLTITTLT
ncbi:MAG: hypothetical protein HYV27_23890 [Candidatus Hydrogenedentes bacterium]|nr:hypothetical protein [Candidatus Hydrogenedentota bacterium]